MRIGVVGNCQAPGIGMALRQLLESHEVLAFAANAVRRDNAIERTAETLRRCDIVFAHPLAEDFGAISGKRLRAAQDNVRQIPPIAFTGFHPDCIFITYAQKPLRSPLEVQHSGIAAAAFSLGLDVDATLRLFNADVYGKLGYFDEFEKARAFLAKTMTAAGLEIGEEWPRWMARGPFMHLVNHPKAFVLAGIAKLAAEQAGLVRNGTRAPEPVHDLLSVMPVWPVYPALAEALGVPGSYLFKKNGGPDLAGGRGVFLNLGEFVAASFAAYASYPAEAFSVASVERVRRVLRETL